MAKINSKGNGAVNAINANSTQVSGDNSTINNYDMSDDMEELLKSNHIKAIDIIRSQRSIISKLQHQIDRMQTQFDVTQDIKNKLVTMLMKLLDEKNNKNNA